jgi:hypothetical protein
VLADYRRRGVVPDRMRRRLEIERVPVGAQDSDRIAALGREAAWQLVDEVRAEVLDE